MTLWLISDTHFGHEGTLTFTDVNGKHIRSGFDSVEEMDEYMIDRWNAVVRDGDHVYHLGDFCMRKEFLKYGKRLKGKKRLVRGNHDIFRTKEYIEAGFKEIHGMRVLGDPKVVLTHAPIHPDCLGRFAGNVHGHIHERPSPEGPYLNVSVERTNYTPISLEDAQQTLRDRV